MKAFVIYFLSACGHGYMAEHSAENICNGKASAFIEYGYTAPKSARYLGVHPPMEYTNRNGYLSLCIGIKNYL